MKLEELKNEVTVRGANNNINFGEKESRCNLEKALKLHMKGIIRTPALSFNNETKSMSDLNLSTYEVSPFEALHDTKGHIKNIWDVLPEVLSPELKEKFYEILKSCYGSKGKVRGADYRLSVILVYQNMKNIVTEDIRDLLLTLLELCFFSYQKAAKRSSKAVLRIFNVSFHHAMLCTNMFKKPHKISKQKLFGIYFHSLTTHLPEVARIISPSSMHAENEERIFSDLNSINLATSSRKNESVRDNSIIRIQMEMQLKESVGNGSTSKMKSAISSISKFSKIGINL